MNIKKSWYCLFLLILYLTGCNNSAFTPPSAAPQVSESSVQPSVVNTPDAQPHTWILPSAEMFGFEGVYGQLYDGIVSFLHTGMEKEFCRVPEVQVFGYDEQAGNYYCSITFIRISYDAQNPSTLETGVGGADYMFTTRMDNGKLVITDDNILQLDGRYDYTKAQLEKVPGLWEAYNNKNLEPMDLLWATPPKEELVRRYFETTECEFTHVATRTGEKQSLSSWLDGL